MNYRFSITTLAIALGLACAPAFAAGPVNASRVSAPEPMLITASQDASGAIVSTARKVYYFNQLDRNHNGLLSRAEIPRDMVNLRRNFVRADFDGNGQLSPEEYVLYSRGQSPQYTAIFHGHVFVYSYGPNDVERVSMAQ